MQPTQVWREEIDAVEKAANRAFVERDYETLERLWADDLVIVMGSDRVQDRADTPLRHANAVANVR
jgi:hypothetical protein